MRWLALAAEAYRTELRTPAPMQKPGVAACICNSLQLSSKLVELNSRTPGSLTHPASKTKEDSIEEHT